AKLLLQQAHDQYILCDTINNACLTFTPFRFESEFLIEADCDSIVGEDIQFDTGQRPLEGSVDRVNEQVLADALSAMISMDSHAEVTRVSKALLIRARAVAPSNHAF